MFFYLVLFVGIYYVAYRTYNYFKGSESIDPKNKYVLITGCDSGFGNLLARELDSHGFHVIAGVLNRDYVSVLQSELSNQASVFRLDITDQADIDSLYISVNNKTKQLHALVNNAGIGYGGYIDWVSTGTFRKIMDVNFFGQVAMVKKFLPMLTVKPDSRIVNVCSVMGFTSAPGMSAYCASKFAFESFSDCLRREMLPWNLHVSIIEPGWLRTPIIQGHEKHLRHLWNGLPPETKERWGDEFFEEKIDKSVKQNLFIRFAEDPMKVVRAMKHAVTSVKPNIRYQPDLQGAFIFAPLWYFPAWIVDQIMNKLMKTETIPSGVHSQID